MKKVILVVLCSLFLVACQSEASIQEENETIILYNKNCAGCHGLDLNGTKVAEGIKGLNKDEILHFIEQGKDDMPANILTGEDAEKVATWISKQK